MWDFAPFIFLCLSQFRILHVCSYAQILPPLFFAELCFLWQDMRLYLLLASCVYPRHKSIVPPQTFYYMMYSRIFDKFEF